MEGGPVRGGRGRQDAWLSWLGPPMWGRAPYHTAPSKGVQRSSVGCAALPILQASLQQAGQALTEGSSYEPSLGGGGGLHGSPQGQQQCKHAYAALFAANHSST